MTMQDTRPDIALTDDTPIATDFASQRALGVDTPVPAVPDQVPAEIAAQHPDAAAVVAAGSKPRGGVHVVSRGSAHRSPARAILGLAACGLVTALAAPLSAPVRAEVAPSAEIRPVASTAPVPTATPSCAPGTSVIVRCTPPCPIFPPVSLNTATACVPPGTSE
jgi:hypothetical protein